MLPPFVPSQSEDQPSAIDEYATAHDRRISEELDRSLEEVLSEISTAKCLAAEDDDAKLGEMITEHATARCLVQDDLPLLDGSTSVDHKASHHHALVHPHCRPTRVSHSKPTVYITPCKKYEAASRNGCHISFCRECEALRDNVQYRQLLQKANAQFVQETTQV